MDNNLIKEYVLSQSQIEFPALQCKFGLSYRDTKKVVADLIASKTIEYVSGITYRVIQPKKQEYFPPPREVTFNDTSILTPDDAQKKLCLKALWSAIKLGWTSATYIQRDLSIDFFQALRVVERLKSEGYISRTTPHTPLLTREEYISKFGNPDGDVHEVVSINNDVVDETEPHWIYRKDADKQGKTDGSPFDRLKNSINDDTLPTSIFPISRTKSISDSNAENADGKETEDLTSRDLRPILIESMGACLKKKDDGEDYILGLSGAPEFVLKFIDGGKSLRISDGGSTISETTHTLRKIRSVLKGYSPVTLEDKEIAISFTNPKGLLAALLTLYAAIDAVKRIK